MVLVTAAAFLTIAAPASADGTVAVTLDGTGSGTVTSTSQEAGGLGTSLATPGQIDCATGAAAPHNVCSASFDFDLFGFSHNGFVTLTATPDDGYIFEGWTQSGASSSARCSTPPAGDPTCRLDLNGTPGPAATVTATFAPPPDVPLVNTDPPTAEGDSTATMNGRVNPGGAAVSKCYFEYGTTTDYGAVAPCDPDAGALGTGDEDVPVSAVTSPLESGTTYHYRLVAANAGGSSEGADRTFTTTGSPVCDNAPVRFAQGIKTVLLPDCMALEMVSPAAKYVQNALRPNVSVDGERVSFVSRGGLDDTSGVIGLLYGDRYVASRGEAGWSTRGMSPPAGEDGHLIYSYGQPEFPSRSMSPDFSRWVTFAATSGQFDDGIARFFRGGLDGSFSPLSPLLVPVDGLHTFPNVRDAVLQAVSADHERVYFTAGDVSTAYLAGDPSPLGLDGTDRNVYVAELDGDGDPSLELLARDGSGTVWGGRCGARVGGVVPSGAGNMNGRNQGAVSGDGDRVLFTTRPAQSGAGACNLSANRLRIMERVEGVGGPQIGELFASECMRALPACSTANGDDLFQGASVDGERVYFTSTRQLADSDLDVGGAGSACSGLFGVAGCDLYLYDSERPAGDRLVQVSAGAAGSPTPGDGAGVLDGIAAVSADGSHAYFVATGVLTSEPNSQGASAVAGNQNLYSFTYDDANPDGRIAFVGAVNAGEQLAAAAGTFKGAAWPVPVKTDGGGVGDGHLLVFPSAASMTVDDTDGGRRDYFRYDSASGDLERVSRAAPGGSDSGPFNVDRATVQNSAEVGTAYGEYGRWVSDDADTLVFTTAEGLVTEDADGATDTYVVRDGMPYLLPGTRATGFDEITPAVSRDGRTVAFTSFAPLLGADGDTVSDIYVARVDGGFEEQLEAVCDPLADECRGTGTAPLDATSNTSAGGTGNATSGERGRVSLGLLTAQRRMALAAGRSVTLAIRVSGPGRVSVNGVASIAGKRRRVIAASADAARAQTLRVPVKLTARGRAALRNRGRLAVRLTVGFSDAPRPAARMLRLARAKRSAHSGGPRR